MKSSTPLLISVGAIAALTLAIGEKGNPTCTPTKAQQILRQKMAELDAPAALPSKEELLNDLQRLHREGKISDQQLEAFKKNINDQYAAPGAPASTDAQIQTQRLIEQKLADTRAPKAAPPPAANQEAQAIAQRVLEQRRAEQQKPAIQPAPAPTAGLTPEQEAKAREALRAKLAPATKPASVESPTSDRQAKALATSRQPSEAKRPAPAPQPSPKPQPAQKPAAAPAPAQKPAPPAAAQATPAPTPKPAPTSVEPAPNPEAQAKALAILRQQQAAQQPSPAPQATPKPQRASKPSAAPAPAQPASAPAAKAPVEVAKKREAKPQQKAAPQPAAKPPSKAAAPVVSTPAPAPDQPAPNPEAQARALAALRQYEQQIKAARVQPETPEPTKPETRPQLVAAPPVVSTPALAPTPTPAAVEPAPNPEAQAKALAALRQHELQEKAGIQSDTPELTKALRLKVAELEGAVPPGDAAQINLVPAVATPFAEPIPLPSSDKEGLERLAELTAIYKANRITPAQYHEERAKIVSNLR